MLSASVFYAVATAQTPTNSIESRIYDAFVRLRANDSLYLQMTGSTAYGNSASPFQNTLLWEQKTLPMQSSKVQLSEYSGSTLQRRIVGDGNTLWSYDLNRKEFSATIYGNFSETQGQNYNRDLLGQLNSAGRGQSAYLIRLVREAYQPSGDSTYRRWAPGYEPTLLTVPTKDPITQHPYTPILGRDYIAYGTTNLNTKRSLVFELSQDPNTLEWDLLNIYYADKSGSNSAPKWTYWVMQIVSNPTIAAGTFSTYPAASVANWRPITSPRPTKIGD